MSDAIHDSANNADPGNPDPHPVGPSEPRWTHLALRVTDIEATIEWFIDFTPLVVVARNQDEAGFGAWLGMPGRTNNPFLLVIAQFLEGKDPFAPAPNATLAPFAHLGIEMPNRSDIDQIAAKGDAAGCLVMPPTMMPAPVGYITMLTDPNGNTVEFSWDQGVYATLSQQWDEADAATEPVDVA